MKTANVALRSAMLALIAGLTLTAGLLPLDTSAQEPRTVATGSNIPVSADAPSEYVVKTGDTLWDIAKVFLRDPWYWPEIWHLNPQVANPHLIFPGDVLKFAYVEGQPRVTVGERGAQAESGEQGHLSPQVRRAPLSSAITSIPYDIIASFMGRPTLLDKDQVKTAPYVVALRDGHLVGASGNEIYARRLKDAPVDARYSVIHIEEPLRDPDNNALLGYSGMYVGSGPIATSGDPAKLILTESTREALRGDKLFPESVDVNVDFVPHSPSSKVEASIIAVRSHTVMGQYQVVALNRGAAHGLEAGHVLAIYEAGETVRDSYSKGGLGAAERRMDGGAAQNVQLPDERIGYLMVFKAFDRMSYALVMESTHAIRQGDRAREP
ncbi:MAG TPA: LysM domain-containing protein [Steroidobacter sp.]|nr:LysM domain-containing protein [Steroidobacter sp.]